MKPQKSEHRMDFGPLASKWGTKVQGKDGWHFQVPSQVMQQSCEPQLLCRFEFYLPLSRRHPVQKCKQKKERERKKVSGLKCQICIGHFLLSCWSWLWELLSPGQCNLIIKLPISQVIASNLRHLCGRSQSFK